MLLLPYDPKHQRVSPRPEDSSHVSGQPPSRSSLGTTAVNQFRKKHIYLKSTASSVIQPKEQGSVPTLWEGRARLDKTRVMPVSTWHINMATCTVVHCHEGEVPSNADGSPPTPSCTLSGSLPTPRTRTLILELIW